MKLAISGLHYTVSMMRYFIEGFEALRLLDPDTFGDLEIWTCGPFFNNWIPWNGGMTLPDKYTYVPNFPLPKTAAQFSIHPQMVVDQAPRDIDLWLQIDAGWHFSARPQAKMVGLIETDPHVLRRHYELPMRYSDICWCMQTPYKETGEIFLPYGVPENWCYPEPKDMKYDVALLGLHYQHRDQLVMALRSKGLKVYYDLGVIRDEMRDVYNSSRVALSWSSLKDTPVRVFEAMGMARPLVANRTPDLVNLFQEDKHFAGFDTIDEAVQKVYDLATGYAFFSETMRWEAHNEVAKHHRFSHRCIQILQDAELLDKNYDPNF